MRRQSHARADGLESQVLDYGHVQRALLPLLAGGVALQLAGQRMRALYERYQGEAARGDLSLLPALHASSCCLKAVATWETLAGIETCRFACGGHGYCAMSGFGHLLGNYMPHATYGERA